MYIISLFWKWLLNMIFNRLLLDFFVYWVIVGIGILIRVLLMVLRDNNNVFNGILNGIVVF